MVASIKRALQQQVLLFVKGAVQILATQHGFDSGARKNSIEDHRKCMMALFY